MKSVFLLCLIFIGVGLSVGDANGLTKHTGRALKEGASVSSSSSASSTSGGSASSSAGGTSTGGTVEVVASATSESFTKVSNKLVEFFKYAKKQIPPMKKSQEKRKYCKTALAKIKKKLKAVASVTAEAYAEAVGTAVVHGSGEACAEARASSASQATGFAKILAEAIASARIGKTKVQAEADVEVVSVVFASVFAKAFAKACIKGEGTSSAVQTTFAKAVIKPLATVSVNVVANVDCGGTTGYSSSDVKAKSGKTGVDTQAGSESTAKTEGAGSATTEGSAGADTGQVDQCAGKYTYCCKLRQTGETCTCGLLKEEKCDAKLISDSPPTWKEGKMRCSCIASYISTHTYLQT